MCYYVYIMPKKATAIKVKQLGQYIGDVAVYKLSKQIKRGGLTSNYVLVSKARPLSGSMHITVFFAEESGTVLNPQPIAEFPDMSYEEVFQSLGYELK